MYGCRALSRAGPLFWGVHVGAALFMGVRKCTIRPFEDRGWMPIGTFFLGVD
jgi:hypothetical protein